MSHFEPACLPSAVGSLPHTDAHEACGLVLRCFPQIPAWPQLPKRTFLENMYVQFSEGFPGVILAADRISIDPASVEPDLERLYVAYLESRTGGMEMSKDYAEGLMTLLSMEDRLSQIVAIKGQVTGPISMGLQVTDQNRRSILYDDTLGDALAKHLRLKAAWQEEALETACSQTIIFVDEPYLSTFGSAYVSLNREQVVAHLEEVLGGLKGLKGVHCCGNTDWAMLLSTSIDIISFDAYHYATPFSLYADTVKGFLRRGGIIAWGIVPNETELLAQETPQSLVQKLLDAMNLLVEKGIALDELMNSSLITPSCGLGTLPLDSAAKACELTSAVSAEMRRRYL